MSYIYLFFAIIFEVLGTTLLKLSNGFVNITPTVTSLAAYGVSFFLFSLCLKAIPLGLAYTVWSGLGIALTTLVGYYMFRQALDMWAMTGMALIVLGVLVIMTLSSSSTS